MRGHRSIPICVLLCALASRGVAQPRPAPAAPPADVEGRLGHVERELAELGGAVAGVAALEQAVAELSSRVVVLRQELDALGRMRDLGEDVTARLDRVDERLATLSGDVAALRSSVQAATGPEAAAATGGAARWDGGFIFATEDGRFSLKPGGYAQLRLRGSWSEKLGDLRDLSWLLRRARVTFDGNAFSPRVTYRVQLALEQDRPLFDYYVDGALPHGFSLRGGQFKVPFSRDWLVQGFTLAFLERSIATDTFRYGRDLGLLASWTGLERRLEVSVGAFNGAGRNVSQNDNEEMLVVARVSGTVLGRPWRPEEGDLARTPAPALVIAAGGTFENAPVPDAWGYQSGLPAPRVELEIDVDADGERDHVQVAQAELDVAFRWRGVGVEAEGYLRREDWGVIPAAQAVPFDPDELYLGGFAQASYALRTRRLPPVLVGARFSATEVSPLFAGDLRRTLSSCADEELPPSACLVSDLRWEASGVASIHLPSSVHGLKVQAMYSFLDWANAESGEDPRARGEQRLLVQGQAMF